MDDVTAELHCCIDRIFNGSTVDSLAATRRARELVALLEGRIVDLARAEGLAWAAVARGPWPGPPDAA